MKIVCIPAYNEEKTIAKIVIESQKYVDRVVVCDDGSNDMTGIIAQRLGAIVIRHQKNMGKGEALRSLFKAAVEMDADAVVTIDADGQHNPGEIPLLLDTLQKENADIVVGSRFLKGSSSIPTHRKFGNKMLNLLTKSGITDTQSGFRAYSKDAVRKIVPSEMGMGVDSEILIEASRLGMKIVEVPVSVRYDLEKTSTYNPIFHTLDVVFSVLKLTSTRHPLLFYGIPGLAFIFAGLYFAYRAIALFTTEQILTNVIMTYEVLALSSIMVGLLSLFTGIILFTLVTLIRKGS